MDDLSPTHRLNEAAAEFLHTVVHQRYKFRRSLVVTSDRVVRDWGNDLGAATIGPALLDRLVHDALMLGSTARTPA
ncbi:ATP-binding protein [Variovorax saccharolyticus]|uniref:ATP-binding protein n=1 Tax=Variovorax saccharolyticus TaxID=3053516 RepID=UPI0025760ABC|nr:ATP-binding protein [Variovorax sp. J31P216]MDM0030201.1 ATP-binding protein [Variovorax sp. J31P216]